MSFRSYGSPRFAFGYQLTPWVKRLLIVNAVIFVAMWILGGRTSAFIVDWFAFYPSSEFLTRPWGAVTYMFLHGGIWHVLLNMLVLFFFGPPLERRWGGGEFLKYFFLCGVGGVLFGFLVPGTGGVPVIGASAAVYGVMLAFAWYWPDSPIYVWGIFPVKAKYLVGFLFFLTVMSTYADTGGGVAHFAHLGGLLVGLVYLKWGGDLGARLDRIKEATRVERFAIVPREEEEEEESRKSGARRRRGRASRKRDADLLDEVDRILDKISAAGMGALTPEERRILDEVSRKRRSN
jgi:membrane associated rhomboid family serine protease